MAILIPILLVFIAGALVALQAPTNALLAKAGGSPVLAALISFTVGTAALLTAWLLSGNRPGTEPFAALPWYAWLGGLYGAVFVAVAAYAAPKIGVASLVTIGIAGQIAMALWLDHLGVMGLGREPISLGRVLERFWWWQAWCSSGGASDAPSKAPLRSVEFNLNFVRHGCSGLAMVRHLILAGALLATSSAAWCSPESDCVLDLTKKNYQQQASTGELAKLIADECVKQQYPAEFEQVALGTARDRDARLVYEMTDILYQMAIVYLKEFRGEAVHLIK